MAGVDIKPIEFSTEARRKLVPDDHLYTWEINPTSAMYKYYRWVFGVDKCKNITFCKLWWSIWFAPLLLLVTIPNHLPERPAKPKKDKKQSARQIARTRHFDKHITRTRYEGTYFVTPAPFKDCKWCQRRVRRNNRAEAITTFVGSIGDKVSAFFQSEKTKKTMKVIFYPILAILGVGVVLGILGGFAYLMYLWAGAVMQGVQLLGIIGGCFAGMCLTLYTFYLLFDDDAVYNNRQEVAMSRLEWFWDEKLWGWMCWGIGKPIKYGAQTGGGFFAAGYHMVKYRTCPKVKVIGVDTSHADRVLERVRNEVVAEVLAKASQQ